MQQKGAQHCKPTLPEAKKREEKKGLIWGPFIHLALYPGKAELSVTVVIKTNTKISIEQEMRMTVSNLILIFEKLCNALQVHTFH